MRVEKTRRLLQELDFQTLFREELGWGNPLNDRSTSLTAKDTAYTRREIAHLGGAAVYEITLPDGTIPATATRAQISLDTQKTQLVHILIFVDKARTQCVWRWLKREGKKEFAREHLYLKGQPGDLFLSKLSPLFVDISELNQEGNVNILDVSRKIEKALDVKPVTKKFYRDYQQQHLRFLELIQGIPDETDRRWYASVLLNRLMFIYFLQKKHFLDKGNVQYLATKLDEVQAQHGEGRYYNLFLEKLFFEGFAVPENERSDETNALIGRVKYLNGGLFLRHKIEQKYGAAIQIPDDAFANLFGLFDAYSWTLDDTPGNPDNEINPDVLGYIFEKYINQKAYGAYYTPPEITEYLCEQTVYKLILDEVNGPEVPAEVPNALAQKLRRKHYADIPELLVGLDADTCRKLVVGPSAILPGLSLLDPACGSGAFLVAAMKTLINIYAGVLGRIPFLNDSGLTAWKAQIEREHPSVNYYIKKQIITNNLYGVDIMEEATEIAKLRLFLTLVASAEKVSQLEPLPNIDFNIMPGNSLVGLLRVNDEQFDNYDLFNKNYSQLVQEKAAAVRAYKSTATFTKDLQTLRDSIQQQRDTAIDTLNLISLYEWHKLGIKYEEATWDSQKGKVGKVKKRVLKKSDIEALTPFHWSFEFDEIMVQRGGFDAIITNPPWEVFKPNAKEFFMEYSELVTKKKMDIQDFVKEKDSLLQDMEVRQAWLDYLSRFPHVSQYYRSSPQYINQISYINGRKAGSDTNLYKLFTEQCYNLLKPGGYCGIIIPSGIYSDLGTKQLRQLLFTKTKVQQLVSLANEKFIFDNVDHRFPFTLLSFEKGGNTNSFQATFRINPREAIGTGQLDSFLHNPETFIEITTDFVKRQSLESLSVMEIRREMDFTIADKILKFPSLGEHLESTWNFSLTREFDMTNDSDLFRTGQKPGMLPLFEGKMMNQFISKSEEGRYYIETAEGRSSILGRNADDSGRVLNYQNYRVALRAVARSSDSRTIIATTLSKNVFCGNSLLVSNSELSESEVLLIPTLLNSLIVDYYARQIVSANINMFYVYQLPVPRLQSGDPWFEELVERAAKLICTTPEYAALWEEVMSTPWTVTSGVIDEAWRNQLRAEIDAIMATLYGLSAEEFTYILTTFPLVAAAQKEATLTEFNRLQAMQPATIFMSYAHEDAVSVERLYQDLTAKGFRVWKDDYELLPGENWEHKIEVALKEHEFVIVCLSASSVGKRGFFQVELKKAARRQAERSVSDVYIIPVKFNDYDPTKLPAEINAIQYVDFSEDWESGIKAIEKTIGKYRRS
ncbi:Eco57I restriction-modification methylase domain-containing protein [Salmonirosea aquatica]|uniref:Eco57I restriction-modification methylase domain-containing protein n=1 Tax=Salmonirosea aquatica TaxID=2654236 RepID=UPI0035713D6D